MATDYQPFIKAFQEKLDSEGLFCGEFWGKWFTSAALAYEYNPRPEYLKKLEDVYKRQVLYRIVHAQHHHTGDAWCIYPMYDFAHPLEDAFEGVTHSLCDLGFKDHRPLYDWVVEKCGPFDPAPCQNEFARLNLTYTIMSKRYLRKMVETGIVNGWDDPRMPTLCGLRRREMCIRDRSKSSPTEKNSKPNFRFATVADSSSVPFRNSVSQSES